jgi:hypothetical protein
MASPYLLSHATCVEQRIDFTGFFLPDHSSGSNFAAIAASPERLVEEKVEEELIKP